MEKLYHLAGVAFAVAAGLLLYDRLKAATAHKEAQPTETPEEQEKRRKEESLLDGFENLMHYDLETARAAVRGDSV